MGLISLYPTAFSVYMSVFDWDWGLDYSFIGLDNYIELIASERFRTALWNTFVFTIAAVAVELVLGIGLALAVDRLGRGAAFVRTLLIVPLMVSGIIVALIWKILLDPTLGPINLVLSRLGVPPLGFLGDPGMGMASIVLIDVWWQTAFVFIVFSAGLSAMPREPLEAAEVDGAGFLARLRFVVLPMLKPVVVVILLFRTIDCLKVFAIIFGTTGGGPLTTTESMQVLGYRIAFREQGMSLSMASMVVFAAIVLVVVIAFLRWGREPQAAA
jgi:multiple sugar transport system permease protein